MKRKRKNWKKAPEWNELWLHKWVKSYFIFSYWLIKFCYSGTNSKKRFSFSFHRRAKALWIHSNEFDDFLVWLTNFRSLNIAWDKALNGRRRMSSHCSVGVGDTWGLGWEWGSLASVETGAPSSSLAHSGTSAFPGFSFEKQPGRFPLFFRINARWRKLCFFEQNLRTSF